MKPAVVFGVCVAATVVTATSHANPRALPFTYTTDSLPAGKVEVEQYVDLDPLKVLDAGTGTQTWDLASAFTTEIEIGLTDRLELGLYMTIVPDASSEFSQTSLFPGTGNGIKQRMRYLFADPGVWPIDVGVYGELSENEREIEFEGKLLLQRRFDRLRVAANLSSEYELYLNRQREYVLNPSAGVTYEVSPDFHLGIDSWLMGEYPMNPAPPRRKFGFGPEAYVGPAVMTNFGRLWWAVGFYVRATDVSHTLQPGEPYGPIYVRSMIGYDL